MFAKGTSVWAERAFAVLLILFGALLGQGLEYWRTFTYVASDIRGHLLSPNVQGDKLEIQLAFVNKGNRQGAVTSVRVVFPMTFDQFAPPARGYASENPKNFSATGIPIVLNPGDIRLVTLRGKLNPETVAFYAKPVTPGSDEADSSKPEMRKQDVALQVRALDFRGRKYEVYWPLGMLLVWNKRFDGYRLPAKYNGADLRVFDETGYSPGSWMALDAIDDLDDESTSATSPLPSQPAPTPH